MRALLGLGRRRAAGLGLILAISLSGLATSSVLAWEGEGGTQYCSGGGLGYVQFKYKDIADVIAPGSSVIGLYRDNDNAWHTRERNGVGGGGYWEAIGEPRLGLDQTWAGCRPYG